jgi:hypothetical protein
MGYLFTSNLIKKWEDKVHTESSLALISGMLSKNIIETSKILSAQEKSCKLIDHQNDTLSIVLDNQFLLNDKKVEHPGMTFKGGQISYLLRHKGNEVIKERSNVASSEFDNISGIRIELDFLHGKKIYEISVTERVIKLKPTITKD